MTTATHSRFFFGTQAAACACFSPALGDELARTTGGFCHPRERRMITLPETTMANIPKIANVSGTSPHKR